MTEREKESTLRLRSRGCGYADIARALGLPEATVKTFCSRNRLLDADLERLYDARRDFSVPLTCLQCGVALGQDAKHKPKRFCSESCRRAWWNARRDAINKKGAHIIACASCGKVFLSYDSHRKFCSHPCYIASRFGGSRHDA